MRRLTVLLWKEYRELRAAWLMVAAAAGVGFVASVVYAQTGHMSLRDALDMDVVLTTLAACALLPTLVTTIERRSRTVQFADRLPVSSPAILASKLIVALCATGALIVSVLVLRGAVLWLLGTRRFELGVSLAGEPAAWLTLAMLLPATLMLGFGVRHPLIVAVAGPLLGGACFVVVDETAYALSGQPKDLPPLGLILLVPALMLIGSWFLLRRERRSVRPNGPGIASAVAIAVAVGLFTAAVVGQFIHYATWSVRDATHFTSMQVLSDGKTVAFQAGMESGWQHVCAVDTATGEARAFTRYRASFKMQQRPHSALAYMQTRPYWNVFCRRILSRSNEPDQYFDPLERIFTYAPPAAEVAEHILPVPLRRDDIAWLGGAEGEVFFAASSRNIWSLSIHDKQWTRLPVPEDISAMRLFYTSHPIVFKDIDAQGHPVLFVFDLQIRKWRERTLPEGLDVVDVARDGKGVLLADSFQERWNKQSGRSDGRLMLTDMADSRPILIAEDALITGHYTNRFSPDGRYVVYRTAVPEHERRMRQFLYDIERGEATRVGERRMRQFLYDIERGEATRVGEWEERRDYPYDPRSPYFSPDGNRLVISYPEPEHREGFAVWDVASATRHVLPLGSYAYSLEVSWLDNDTVVALCRNPLALLHLRWNGTAVEMLFPEKRSLTVRERQLWLRDAEATP